MSHRGMDTEFELEWQKIKADKKLTRLFSIESNAMFRISVHRFFFNDIEMIWREAKITSSWREVRVIWSQLYSIQSEDSMWDVADIYCFDNILSGYRP